VSHFLVALLDVGQKARPDPVAPSDAEFKMTALAEDYYETRRLQEQEIAVA